jgi:ATPase family AAA domain-containing protein 3A/B
MSGLFGGKKDQASYENLKKALDDERALLTLMTQLEPAQYEKLMEASKEYAAAYKSVYDAQKEAAAAQRAQQGHQFAMERAQADAQNALRLEEKRTEEEKQRIEFQLRRVTEEQSARTRAKLEAQKEFERLDAEKQAREKLRLDQQAQREEAAREKEFQRQQRALEAKMRKKAELARENELALADHKIQQHKAKHEVEKDYLLERAKSEAQIRADSNLATAKARYKAATAFFSGPEGRERMENTALAVALSAVGVYAAKTVYPIAQRALQNYFFKPSLINRRVVHRNTAVGRMLQRATSRDPAFALPETTAEGGVVEKGPRVVLPPELRARMTNVIAGTRVTAERGGFFGHMLLWGQPGTGKTLFAEKMAMECGMDFAIMSGPSFDQFHPKDAIVEIKELFKWANRSSRPVLLFVDEADSFLEDRSTLHPDRVRVLNEFINQTGTESRKFMLCYETNRPEVLDPAVQSRVTRAVEFGKPGVDEIAEMLAYYVQGYVAKQERVTQGRFGWFSNMMFNKQAREFDVSAFDEAKTREVARRLVDEGFVGRDVSNMVIALAQELYAAEKFELTEDLIDVVVQRQLEKKRQDKRFAESRAMRMTDHFKRLSSEE